MTRLERIEWNRSLGLDTAWLEKLTDEQYEQECEWEYEKRAKIARQYGKH